MEEPVEINIADICEELLNQIKSMSFEIAGLRITINKLKAENEKLKQQIAE